MLSEFLPLHVFVDRVLILSTHRKADLVGGLMSRAGQIVGLLETVLDEAEVFLFGGSQDHAVLF